MTVEENGPPLLKSNEDGVITLTLNRPRQFNVLSEEMLGALSDALATIAADDSARCVIIAAAGKAFCAGHDLKEMRATPDEEYYRALFARCAKVMTAIVNLPVPAIARVHGVATAAGCQLVAACDLAIAGESARFAVSGVNLGLFCATPAVALSRNVAAKRAFDMLVTGRFIDARTALDWGLVNAVVGDDALGAAVAEKAAQIRAKSPAAVRYGKAMFARQRQMPLAEAYEFAGAVMARNMMEPDTAALIDGFINKPR